MSSIPNEFISPLVKRLWRHISANRRRQFALLLLLMLLASLGEVLSIGSILPFLGALTAPDRIFAASYLQPVIAALGISSPQELLFPMTVFFGIAAILAGFMRLLLLYTSTRLSFATGADLSISIYRRTLYQPYAIHCGRNSSQVIDGISTKANGVIYSVINPLLTLISSGIMLVAILVTILMIEPSVAVVAFGGFGAIYAAIIFLTRHQLLIDSKTVARDTTQVIKSLQEGLGGIRDVLIDGSQEVFCRIYSSADSSLRQAQANNLFIGASPRFIVEAAGMLLIAFLAYLLVQRVDGVAKAIPILGVLALGAQRLLPVLQQAYSSWVQINGARFSLRDTLELLDQPLPDHFTQPRARLPFMRNIELKQIQFRYSSESPYVLKNINLSIRKGDRLGFIGATASGKSTLLDVVMGLLSPTEGSFEVDGKCITSENCRAWQERIAHVPQTIFLADSTVEENIAFGIPSSNIERDRVRWAANQAQIAQSIDGWPEGYQTFVGEQGIRLSGGQRQRIGIARALYKRADVIIFDEATSALDGETEESVMQAIEGLGKELTLLIIAHRVTTLKGCSQIVELSRGAITRIGSYKEIVG